jgi:hypothetical protein
MKTTGMPGRFRTRCERSGKLGRSVVAERDEFAVEREPGRQPRQLG